MIESFPGRPAHLIWGNLKEYPGPNEAGLQWTKEWVAEFPWASRFWLGPFIPLICIYHPDTTKLVLKSSEPKSHNAYRLIEPWIGTGLLVANGGKWKRNRRLLTPAFHFDVLKNYQLIMNKTSDILLTKLENYAETGEIFEVFSNISMFTLDTMLQSAFAYEIDCQTIGENHPYVVAVHELVELVTERFLKPWLHNDLIYLLTTDGRKFKKHCDFVHKVAEDIISKRRKAINLNHIHKKDLCSMGLRSKFYLPTVLWSCVIAPWKKEAKGYSQKKSLDFLDILLSARDENNQGLTDLEIRNEADTFLFEGHDTTASALSWALYSLAEHPEIQKKLQAEVDEVLKGRDSDEILWEDLPKLQYTTMCLKEAMRLHTPVPFIQRELTEPMELDGHEAPAGTQISIMLYNCHHNPLVWPNSMDFIPERFSPENVEKRDAYAFIPFSAGPRNCIGQQFALHEMKTVLAKIFRRYSLELDPTHKVEKYETLVMRSQTGIKMKAYRR
ncbi:Cytochrome P450 4F22,Leukotriene-B(4) omega-hydroxylase 2,Phylloquinone omega-hydroxylase CYP4F2,Cytochrome P450 4F4,Cytochrome P450 4F8,Cytochrome P450 4F5,Cytochrome P450 4F12,Docosahexaenoic acid omega-hydroxylase CYP4F3,Cytochrome P450 4B1 [Mytilus edulis]|uniref:Cytochrome P450 n=1 Tax=Mytilus edulis TaxID=6550 RepID=A0A8S3THB8_MYTED|nr:Cytochrome P450 4F22,Leukotriene-B(4) omega-hydroxylase 2,Phylloquinone omega-hydroxylase CYP4F2,Cytochrome P450 4F4,Cytochrome P450 4F8,Cytochrome P450 4F5,Cytochrome P450 4F12,Docosahexaenoic acid omega-hydroxylase CYP4F3,Cytochrome P450 4B1 [Mytilus edulis]